MGTSINVNNDWEQACDFSLSVLFRSEFNINHTSFPAYTKQFYGLTLYHTIMTFNDPL